MTNTPAELRALWWHQRPQCLASFGLSFILSISFFQHLNVTGYSEALMKPAFLWVRKSVLPSHSFPPVLTQVVSNLSLLPVPPSAFPHHSVSTFFLTSHSSCSAKSVYICSWAGAAFGAALMMATKPKDSWTHAEMFSSLVAKVKVACRHQTLLMLKREFDYLWDQHPRGFI